MLIFQASPGAQTFHWPQIALLTTLHTWDDLGRSIQLLEYAIPLSVCLSSCVTKNPGCNISGTESHIIDPLVSKRPGKKSKKKSQKNHKKISKKNLKKISKKNLKQKTPKKISHKKTSQKNLKKTNIKNSEKNLTKKNLKQKTEKIKKN